MFHVHKELWDQGQCRINKGQMIKALGTNTNVLDNVPLNPNSVGHLEI